MMHIVYHVRHLVKLFLFNYVPRHEGVWGNGGTAPRILNLETS